MAEAQYAEREAERKEVPRQVVQAARARARRPSRRTPFGAVAAARVAGVDRRQEAAERIRAEDDLVAGQFGAIRYKPATVQGIDLRLEPLQPSIGTAVHGLDVAAHLKLDDPPANAELVAFLRALWLERGVLVFRGQGHLTREQMAQFAGHFGKVGAEFGEPSSPGGQNTMVLRSDEAAPGAAISWHADATWQQRPPMASMLMCREAPPVGGDTCFCDCYAMWEGLPPETKRRVEHLTAVHVSHEEGPWKPWGKPFSCGVLGEDGKPPVAVHPVARTHPETGRTTLYVQQGFVRRFAEEHDVPPEEARQLLLQMKFQEGRPEYTCRVRWESGSIALWDNRAVLHTVAADFWPHRRLMERLTIRDFDEARSTPYYAPAG